MQWHDVAKAKKKTKSKTENHLISLQQQLEEDQRLCCSCDCGSREQCEELHCFIWAAAKLHRHKQEQLFLWTIHDLELHKLTHI